MNLLKKLSLGGLLLFSVTAFSVTAFAAAATAVESSQDGVASKWTIEKSGDQVVGNIAWSINFTINRPVGDVWRHMKDFNSWMDDLHYNCVVGDAAEGSSIYFTYTDKMYAYLKKVYGTDAPQNYKKTLIVRRNEPGKLIVWEELSADQQKTISYYVWAFSEHEGKTSVTGWMGFAPHSYPNANEQKLRLEYRSEADEVVERWNTAYIPRLRQLVENR